MVRVRSTKVLEGFSKEGLKWGMPCFHHPGSGAKIHRNVGYPRVADAKSAAVPTVAPAFGERSSSSESSHNVRSATAGQR